MKKAWLVRMMEVNGQPSSSTVMAVVGFVVGSISVLILLWRNSVPVGFAEILLAYMGITVTGRGWSKYVEMKHGRSSSDVRKDLLETPSSDNRGSSGIG